MARMAGKRLNVVGYSLHNRINRRPTPWTILSRKGRQVHRIVAYWPNVNISSSVGSSQSTDAVPAGST